MLGLEQLADAGSVRHVVGLLIFMVTPALPCLPERPLESHKGDFGRALIVGGSRGMSGAVALAGMGALRAGAGLVTLAVPDDCLETVAAFEPSYMTRPLPSKDGQLQLVAKEELPGLIDVATCVACGPGLGRGRQLEQLVGWLYESVRVPLVVDADGLHALAMRSRGLADAAGPRILTPHPGEFRRLVSDNSSPAQQLRSRAVELARVHGIVIVFKGHRTLVTDGEHVIENDTGNPGMATGGSGDVLTGVITALVCQGLSPREAAQLGVHVHGMAGDLAARDLGQVSLVARDLVDYLPRAFQEHRRARQLGT
jgi:NAD(P)H-hydrate epimerase